MSAPERIWAQRSANENWEEPIATPFEVKHFHCYLRATPAREHADELAEALREFVRRCERGEIRSKKTYAKFKSIIANLDKYSSI